MEEHPGSGKSLSGACWLCSTNEGWEGVLESMFNCRMAIVVDVLLLLSAAYYSNFPLLISDKGNKGIGGFDELRLSSSFVIKWSSVNECN